jgi:hypothetical protein
MFDLEFDQERAMDAAKYAVLFYLISSVEFQQMVFQYVPNMGFPRPVMVALLYAVAYYLVQDLM